MKQWYQISNVEAIDSPALIIYEERVQDNIRLAIQMAGDADILRPHVKTNKMAEVCQMMMNEGITKFKCATIAEAEMLGSVGAKDVLVAFPIVGPKMQRFIDLIIAFPATEFACLADNDAAAIALSALAVENHLSLNVYIDLNIGMNRTGVSAEDALPLYRRLTLLNGITVKGLHAYDGHVKAVDIQERQRQSDEVFSNVQRICNELGFVPRIIVGGSPTFPTHVKRKGVECSPGTFVFWDHGYKTNLPEQPFDYAALVLARIISITDQQTICTDLGYKSVSAEGPLPRVYFLNAPDAIAVAHSEEHLVLKVEDASVYKPGDTLYGVPMHICPTVALYEKAWVIKNNVVAAEWTVIARDRKINI